MQVLVIATITALVAALTDANLPLQASGRSRGDEHSTAAAEAGYGEENDHRYPVGTSGEPLNCQLLSTTSSFKVASSYRMRAHALCQGELPGRACSKEHRTAAAEGGHGKENEHRYPVGTSVELVSC